MLEELCRTAFWKACKEVFKKNYELVCLKSFAERNIQRRRVCFIRKWRDDDGISEALLLAVVARRKFGG